MKRTKEKNICFIDFETTGHNPCLHYPIQVGAVLVTEELEITKNFCSFIRPPSDARNTDIAYKFHQIELSRLKNAPLAEKVLNDFFELFGTNYNFASWNVSFDVSFFRKLCHDNNKMDLFDKISYRHIDIQSICGFLRRLQIIDPDVRSLEDCTRYFKLSRSAAHDALEDSVLALEVYKNLLKISRSAYRFDMAVIR